MKGDIGEHISEEYGRNKLVGPRSFSCLLHCTMHIDIEAPKLEDTVGSSQGRPSSHSMALVGWFSVLAGLPVIVL
jgi:hypothetical protein